MRAFHAGRREDSLQLAMWLSGTVGLLAAGLTVLLMWAVLARPATVFEAFGSMLGLR